MAHVAYVLLIWISFLSCSTQDEDFYYHPPSNRSTPSGIQAYRSALTLDWLAAEDTRQRELVAAFESEPTASVKIENHDCIAYPRPAPGKVARLMLELLKNLEGDDGVLVTDLIHALIRSKLLVLETSVFDAEPDLEALVKTPGAMMGEPHVTFPRILAMVWLTVTDPGTVKRHGWCHINKVSKYLVASKPSDIAKNMRALEPMIARARFVMEEFIQHVTPLNIMRKTSEKPDHDKTPKHVPKPPDRATRRTYMNRPFLSKITDMTNETTIPPPPPEKSSDKQTAARRFMEYDRELEPFAARGDRLTISKFLISALICVCYHVFILIL